MFYYIMPGFVIAWYNPTWDSWSYDFSFTRFLWYQIPCMMVGQRSLSQQYAVSCISQMPSSTLLWALLFP
jgi:hypothetical protein